MENRPLSLAYSPCPNDTYIFAGLTNGLIEDAPSVRVVLEDVESLNTSALKGDYELTKASYAAVPALAERYRILRSGGALGRGCGPLLVARPGTGSALHDFAGKLIAIPGERTTAFLLLRLALERSPHIIQMRFDNIVEAVKNGVVDAGLIIHESRFTYEKAGLVKVADLGEWWEQTTGKPIPLGAILVRNDIEETQAKALDASIRRSLQFARDNERAIMPYVRENAPAIEDEVLLQHINLYVNAYTDDLGDEGMDAVRELFAQARDARLIPQTREPEFV